MFSVRQLFGKSASGLAVLLFLQPLLDPVSAFLQRDVIFVQTPAGHTLSVDVSPADSGADVKARVIEQQLFGAQLEGAEEDANANQALTGDLAKQALTDAKVRKAKSENDF